MSWTIRASTPASQHCLAKLSRRFEFGIVQDGVERDVDADVKAVREFDQRGDVAHGIACRVPGAERRTADVDGIGAVQDRLAADGGCLGGGEEFDRFQGGGVCHGVVEYTAADVSVEAPLTLMVSIDHPAS